jgi:hypothetical protein
MKSIQVAHKATNACLRVKLVNITWAQITNMSKMKKNMEISMGEFLWWNKLQMAFMLNKNENLCNSL